jgi:hypothetical protein
LTVYGIDVSRVNALEVVSFTVLIAFVPSLLLSNRMDPDVRRGINNIRGIAKEAGLSKAQTKLLYIELARGSLERKELPGRRHSA